MEKHFQVLSPDGLPIGFETYDSQESAEEALKLFASRYEAQGYYSTYTSGLRVQIPLEQITNFCTIVEC
jgi:hypothetical protein